MGPSEKREGASGGSVGKTAEAERRDADPEGADACWHGRGKFRVGGMGAPEGKE